ncbi:MAG: PKD domain-containing protein [Acidobacteriota bacterium]
MSFTHRNTKSFAQVFAVLAALLVVGIVLAPSAAQAQADCTGSVGDACGFDSCATPAYQVPSGLWDELRPVGNAGDGRLPLSRDTTDYSGNGNFEVNPWWESLDIENGWLFTVANLRFQIWDVRGGNAATPSVVYDRGFSSLPIQWANDAHAFDILLDVDAPNGVDDVFAAVGGFGMGMVVFRATDKSSPTLIYQDQGQTRWSREVYSARIGAREYAFVAAEQGTGGVFIYDLTAAKNLTSLCVDSNPGGTSNCPGVYLGKLGTRTFAKHIDGAGNFVAVASTFSPKGFEIWNVANPSNPQKVMDGATSDNIYSLAMWQNGSSYYLATRTDSQLRIYNVSCITGGACGAGAPIWSTAGVGIASDALVTNSVSNGTPFLYVGTDSWCLQGNQHEWLYDVSNPSSPRDISPQGTIIDNGDPVGYWNWYYRPNGVHGYNRVKPRVGKFNGNYFYRAAYSIFDVHERTTGSPPVANFTYNPTEVYPGENVNFVDTSTGNPTSWNWNFGSGATPASSTAENPTGVTYSTPGNRTVTLQVSNAVASDNTSQTLTVIDPAPVAGSVAASPNPALLCQPVTFQANGATGRPPLGFAWQVRDDDGTVVSSGNGNPFVWTSNPNDTTGISYTAEVTVSNGDGSDTATSLGVLLNAPPDLPGTGNFTPTYAGAPNPPSTGSVDFSVNVPGATEWNWDFGDGDGYQGWTADPINGPSPTFSYDTIGDYSVRVKVRNCLEAEQESNPVSVSITSVIDLSANFRAQLFCQAGICFATRNVAFPVIDNSTGPPDFWDYDWNGDGNFEDVNNTSPVTTHTYTSTGDFTPRLRVRKGSQTDTFTHEFLIRVESGTPPPPPPPPPGASITVNGPSFATVGQASTFSATASNCNPSATGWTWTTAGGSGTSNTSSISITWSTAGSKTIQARNSACGTVTGSRTVTVNTGGGGGGGGGGDVGANFTYSPSAPTAGQTVSFDGSSSTGNPGNYSWDFGDGNTGSGATTTHAFSSNGSYQVTLSVSRQDSSCTFGVCEDSQTRTVAVGGVTPPPPPPPTEVNASFTANVCAFGSAGGACPAETGQEVIFTDTSSGPVTSRSWNFGDGTTGTGSTPTHTWTQPGTYLVTLTVSGSDDQDSTSRNFTVTGDPPTPDLAGVVLPWVVQGQAALDQVTALYIHNGEDVDRSYQATFYQRPGGTGEEPPTSTINLDAGATAYYDDLIDALFDLDNVSGFVHFTAEADGAANPVVIGYHRTIQPDGTLFGQAVPGVDAQRFPKSSDNDSMVLHLAGLNDNSNRLGFFGITNPSDEPARVQLRFYNAFGEEIGADITPLTVAAKGQRQFQIRTIRDRFGITDEDDYRVELEVLSGGPVYPYGANLRIATEDPSFIRAGNAGQSRSYLIGALATAGLNDTVWQTDALITNITGSSLQTHITYLNVGNTATPETTVNLGLFAGESVRITDILEDRWNLSAGAVGLLIFENDGLDDVYPMIHGETYENSNPAQQYGQFMAPLEESEAASFGDKQILVGLQQDENSRTTVWLFNPSDEPLDADLRYRALDGTLIETTRSYRVRPGKMRQISPGQHPLPGGQVIGGFTIQIVPRSGSILSAAQVVRNDTGDPAFLSGITVGQ